MDGRQDAPPRVLPPVRASESPYVWIGIAAVVMFLLAVGAGYVGRVTADGGPNHDLSHNVQDGPRNGIVTGVYADEICFTLKAYVAGGRNDDHTSCASKSEVKNLGKDYDEGAVHAKAVEVNEAQPQVYSITAFEIKGGDSGLLLDAPVSQEPAIVEPTPTSTVPAPVLPSTGGDGS